MNIEQFDELYKNYKSSDKITIHCDHPNCSNPTKILGKQPARRNILKNGGSIFICRDCFMKYNNPMNRVGQSRQTEEEIKVLCPQCNKIRQMKKCCYYGLIKEPYHQICGTCAQRGKEISNQQKEAISKKLSGRKLSEEHKAKIMLYRKNNPEWRDKAIKNLIPGMGGIVRKGLPLPEEWKQAISDGTKGKKKSLEHRYHISIGRKQMLEEQGGLKPETKQKLRQAAKAQYRRGFDPRYHHVHGWHFSPKLGTRVFYRSSYEKKAYMLLDQDETIKSYSVETVDVMYHNPVKNTQCEYLIDLLIEYQDGSKKLVEVKPEKQWDSPVVRAKLDAGDLKAKELGMLFEVWGETFLFGKDNTWRTIQQFKNNLKGEQTQEFKETLLKRIEEEFNDYKKYYTLLDWELDHYEQQEANVWVVWQNAKGEKFLDLIHFVYSEEHQSWACGDSISELECPVATNCPIRLLELTPQETNPYYFEDWRQFVREGKNWV